MKFFDPFAFLSFRSASDHRAMARAGVCAVLEPCAWPGYPRTQAGTFQDDFSALVSFERARAGRAGLRYFSALALDPREAGDPAVAVPVLNLLQRYLSRETVLAVGETGYDALTEAEDAALEWQLHLGKRFGLPVLVRVPAAPRLRAIRRALDLVRRSGIAPERVVLGPNDEETLPVVLAAGCWAGHALCARAGFDVPRMAALARRFGTARLLVGSGADWDVSDALAVPRLASALGRAGMGGHAIAELLWRNPVAFFAQSGRLPEDLRRDAGRPEREPEPEYSLG